jgi:hypothetical protein
MQMLGRWEDEKMSKGAGNTNRLIFIFPIS